MIRNFGDRLEQPKMSIIIPCKKIDDFTEKCVEGCKNLDYDNHEIVALPDKNEKDIEGIEIIETGPVTPGKKRNIGIDNSNGEFLAFIDSDAYPRRDWLKNAIKYFEDPGIAAIGGPGITPSEDSFLQKASGCVLSSFMVGSISNRFKIKKVIESDDVHSCNFIARRSVVEKIRWDEKYWPGEDTLISLGIKNLRKKMLEASDVVVHHHRRPLFLPHLKQVSRFGMHRGFFAKRFPKTSFKAIYFFPSFIFLFLIIGSLLNYFFPVLRLPFVIGLLLYIGLAFVASLNKDIKYILPVWIGIFLTHITYGLFFMIGLLKMELKR